MPELPEQKRVFEVATPAPHKVDYAELHCITNFSFLEGASHPDELVSRAGELGYRALAITDRNSLAGVVRAHTAATQIVTRRRYGRFQATDWRRNRIGRCRTSGVVGYRSSEPMDGLRSSSPAGRRNAPKGECRITFDDVAEYQRWIVGLSVLRQRAGRRFSSRRAALSRGIWRSLLSARGTTSYRRRTNLGRVTQSRQAGKSAGCGGGRNSLSCSRAAAAGRCADRDSRRPACGRLRRVAAHQCRAASENGGGTGASCFRPHCCGAPLKWPSGAHSHSKNCVMSIPKSWRRPAKRRSSI